MFIVMSMIPSPDKVGVLDFDNPCKFVDISNMGHLHQTVYMRIWFLIEQWCHCCYSQPNHVGERFCCFGFSDC